MHLAARVRAGSFSFDLRDGTGTQPVAPNGSIMCGGCLSSGFHQYIGASTVARCGM